MYLENMKLVALSDELSARLGEVLTLNLLHGGFDSSFKWGLSNPKKWGLTKRNFQIMALSFFGQNT